ncbi:TPA: hypothetical protein DDW35_08355 [Candidatus Sumerlaeota bacterium]|nr:hypothetical protein [Candidatus Sumerlaeota bacterium]
MKRSNLKRVAFLLPLLISTCGLSLASFDQYAADDTNPINTPKSKMNATNTGGLGIGVTPSPSASVSHVDNYINQNDQLNINPKDGLIKVLRVNQKNEINRFVPKLIQVKSVKVRELRNIAREIVRLEGGDAEVVNDTVKGQTFIQVTCPPFQVPYVEAAIHALDKEWLTATDDGTEVGKYAPKFRSVEETDTIAMVYAKGGVASSTIDRTNNTATHWNDPGQVKNYVSVSQAADIPVSEIKLDASFYEVTDNTATKIGLDYLNWKNGPGSNLFKLVEGASRTKWHETANTQPSVYAPWLAVPGESLYKESLNYASTNAWVTAAYVDFLKTRSKAKVVATASLHTVSGQSASWTDSQPVVGITSTAVTPDTSKTAVDPKTGTSINSLATTYDRTVTADSSDAVTVGLTLAITPYIGTESTELDIDVTSSNISGTTAQNLPLVDTRHIVTTARVRDGETVLLAGLKRTNKAKNNVGLPFLSTVPYAGYLFGNESTADEKSDVVIALDSTISVNSPSKIAKTSGKLTETAVKAVKGADYFHNCYGFDQWMLDHDGPTRCTENCSLATK